jgi:hypothetical protein
MIQHVEIGPFSLFFTNVNTEMNLRGHSHFATLTLRYRITAGERGFPAFAPTYAAIQNRLTEKTSKPFRDCTNESVARLLFAEFDTFTHPDIAKWGGEYCLDTLLLAVRGVPDSLGHADGFTTYSVTRDPQEVSCQRVPAV